jgi:hypothetical protein
VAFTVGGVQARSVVISVQVVHLWAKPVREPE